MKSQEMKLFKALVTIGGEVQEVPMWARTIDEALEALDNEYGEDAVMRLRPEVSV